MENNTVEVLPNAAILIESMRSIGYTFKDAIADIIDNSISAKATDISIYMRQKDENYYVQIVDDGNGMNESELIEAMRLGSKDPQNTRAIDDLGRFGLGLKSASFSQCKKLTVISKKNDVVNGFMWDLDYVRKINHFMIKKLTETQINNIPNIAQLYEYQSGTIVQWEDFDRIEAGSHKMGDELTRLMDDAANHISLVFHRFLEDHDFKLSINYTEIEPKDPFLRNNPRTQQLQSKKVKLDGVALNLYPYVLPFFSTLNLEERKKAGIGDKQYELQGIYLYRNKRLIVWGDYLGLYSKSELTKNTRIQVDIPNTLDYLWELDVKKSKARIPSKIKKNILSVIHDGVDSSKRVNNFRGKKEISKKNPTWLVIKDRDDEFRFELNKDNELYNLFYNSLDENQKKLFKLYSNSVVETIPYNNIYSQVSSGYEQTNIDDEQLLNEVMDIFSNFTASSNQSLKKLAKTLLLEEIYNSNKKVFDYLVNQMGE